MVAARSGDDEGVVLLALGTGEALVVVHVGGEHDIGMHAGSLGRSIEQILHLLAAAVMAVGGKRWVVQSDQDRLVAVGLLELVDEPILLRLLHLAALRHVGIEPDERRERRQQRPIWIGLVHGLARRGLRLGSPASGRGSRAEIFYERPDAGRDLPAI